MKEIKLWNLCGLALIIPKETGIIVTNQAGGTACAQPKIEGYIIPISNDYRPEIFKDSLEHKITEKFNDGTGVIDSERAEFLDSILNSFPETKGITVDKNMIHESVESWVHVNVIESQFSCFAGFGFFKAILTWPNSD